MASDWWGDWRPTLPTHTGNLQPTDLIECTSIVGGLPVNTAITGAQIIAAASSGATWGSITGTLSSQTDLQSALNGKQATLVSGTNIKTVNSTSLLGSGDVAVQATLVSGTNIKTINGSSILGSGDLTVSGSNIYNANGTLTAARTLTQGGFALTIAGTTSSRFHANGNLGIGTTTDAGYKLDVNGTIRSTGDIRIAGGALYCIGLLAGTSNTKIQTYTNNGLSPMHSITFGYYSTTFDAQDITFNGPVNSKFFGQSTGNWIIGSTTSYASAQLGIDSTTKGFLPPRMTNAQMLAIASPATGLVVYDTTNNKHCGYNGTAWQNFY